MSRVLVTGASGFLGKHVAACLTRLGRTVVTVSRNAGSAAEHVAWDLSSNVVPSFPDSFTEVYHVAGLAHFVPVHSQDAERFYAVNRDGTRNLLRAIDHDGRLPQSFVLVSTVAVYGLQAGTGLDEQTCRAATDPYGESKRQAEDAVAEWCEQRGVRCGIVRLPLVVGDGAPGNLRAMATAMKSGRYLGIADGAARRSMVAAADVAAILPVVAERGGTFHLTDGRHPTFAEIEAALAQSLRIRSPRRLPYSFAAFGARAGDRLEKLLRRNLPLSTRVLEKMTSTLTFSDAQARCRLAWNPSPALDHVTHLLDPATC